MKKNVALTIISILAILAVVFGILYVTNNSSKTKEIAEKTGEIEKLTAEAAEKSGQIESLTADAAEKAGQIETLTADAAEKAGQIETLTADAARLTDKVKTKNVALDEKNREVKSLMAGAKDKDEQIAALTAEAAEKDGKIGELTAESAAKDKTIETLTADAAAKDSQIETLNAEVKKQADEIASLTAELEKMKTGKTDSTDKSVGPQLRYDGVYYFGYMDDMLGIRYCVLRFYQDGRVLSGWTTGKLESDRVFSIDSWAGTITNYKAEGDHLACEFHIGGNIATYEGTIGEDKLVLDIYYSFSKASYKERDMLFASFEDISSGNYSQNLKEL